MEVGKKTNDFEGAVADVHAPRKLTFAENAILTIKVLSVVALIMCALWGVNLWTSK